MKRSTKVQPAFENPSMETSLLDEEQPTDTPSENQPKPKQKKTFRQAANVLTVASKWKQYLGYRRMCHNHVDRSEVFTGLEPVEDSTELLGATLTQTFDQEEQIRKNFSYKLLVYFSKYSQPNCMEDFVDLSYIYSLIENGADVNIADKYGQTILHEVAHSWGVDVARFFFYVGGANLNVRDAFGRTPLHVAALSNYPEMITFLIEAGADKEATTDGELQTPVFYAAKSGAVQALTTLLKAGCMYKRIRDYKQRTPLYVAAEQERVETASRLLKEGAPADVKDDCNVSCMVPLVTNMAPVARDALDQFYALERANREQRYYLARLEPESADEYTRNKYSSVLFVLVQNRQFELIGHPVIARLTDAMWRNFGKMNSIGKFCLQLFYVVLWSTFGVSEPWTTKYNYTPLSAHWWRLIVLIVAIIFMVYLILGELNEYRISSRNFETIKSCRLDEIARDEAYCHPCWPTEKYFLDSRKKAFDDMQPFYFQDYWNYYDWLCYICLFTCILTHIVDIFHHNLLLARWHIRIMAFSVILIWLKLMKTVRAMEHLGPFIVVLSFAVRDLLMFACLYLDVYIPFVFAFWMVIGGVDNVPGQYVNTSSQVPPNVTRLAVSGFTNVADTIYTVFMSTVGGDVDFDTMSKIDHTMIQILLFLWILISAVLCLNILIALLSNTFVRVFDNSKAYAKMQRAITILVTLERLTTGQLDKYHTWLQKKGNPEVLYYKADKFVSGEEKVTEATIVTRDNVLNLREKWDDNFGETEFDGLSPLEDDCSPILEESLKHQMCLREFIEKNRQSQHSDVFEKHIEETSTTTMEERFSLKVQNLHDNLQDLRTQQMQLSDHVKKELHNMHTVLRDIASAITSTPTASSQHVTFAPESMAGTEGESTGAGGVPRYPPPLVQVEPADDVEDYTDPNL